jgi:hypothetical protein
MTRGIQLKQLTRAHLELLGLPEGAGPSVQDPPVAGIATNPPRVGPPASPAPTMGQGARMGSGRDRQPLDLRALAREVRLELEITLLLLDGATRRAATSD